MLNYHRERFRKLTFRALALRQPLRPRSFLATLKITMPNLKTLTKELRREIVSYLYPLPSISSNLAFRLAIHIFTKTRFSSHINFISRCHSQMFPFKFSRVHFFQCFQFQPKIPSRNSAYPKHFFTQHYEKHDQSHVLKMQRNQQANYRMSLSTFKCMFLCFITGSIHTKIQFLNSKLFHHLEQTKKHKLENLTNPRKPRTAPLENQNRHTVVTIPENLPLSNAEKSVLGKGLNFVPISKKSDEFTTRQDVEKFLRRVQLKAFFHNKEDKSDNTEKDAFETLTAKKIKMDSARGPIRINRLFHQKMPP